MKKTLIILWLGLVTCINACFVIPNYRFESIVIVTALTLMTLALTNKTIME